MATQTFYARKIAAVVSTAVHSMACILLRSEGMQRFVGGRCVGSRVTGRGGRWSQRGRQDRFLAIQHGLARSRMWPHLDRSCQIESVV